MREKTPWGLEYNIDKPVPKIFKELISREDARSFGKR
jgi:hypothetical protein